MTEDGLDAIFLEEPPSDVLVSQLNDAVSKPLPRWHPEAMIGRRSGRSTWARMMTALAAGRGEHVHYLGTDGQWCVTAQPIGLLFLKVPSAKAGLRPLRSIAPR